LSMRHWNRRDVCVSARKGERSRSNHMREDVDGIERWIQAHYISNALYIIQRAPIQILH
jgi:hypothetical protein